VALEGGTKRAGRLTTVRPPAVLTGCLPSTNTRTVIIAAPANVNQASSTPLAANDNSLPQIFPPPEPSSLALCVSVSTVLYRQFWFYPRHRGTLPLALFGFCKGSLWRRGAILGAGHCRSMHSTSHCGEEEMLEYLAYALLPLVVIGCLLYVTTSPEVEEPPNPKRPGPNQ
jgi:hypothetical protein